MVNRNKWKRNHDEKLNKLLGMNYQTARSQLERMVILEAFKELGRGNCFQCGFPIEKYEDMSLEHKIPYGGNEAKNIQGDKDLFWSYSNICLSHLWCNCSAGPGGSGKYKYVGIHDYYDRRKNPPYKYIRAEISVKSKGKVLGYFDSQEEAGIAYDLGLMIFRKGIGKLNFPDFRDRYLEQINTSEYLKSIINIEYTRLDRRFVIEIRKIVNNMYNILKIQETLKGIIVDDFDDETKKEILLNGFN